jgi:outer membrane protein assembly factor BamB
LCLLAILVGLAITRASGGDGQPADEQSVGAPSRTETGADDDSATPASPGDSAEPSSTEDALSIDRRTDRNGDRQPDRSEIGVLDTETSLVDPASSGLAWSALGAVDGLLTFRGNPTRTYHGRGPVPQQPIVQWEVEIGCSNSAVAGEMRLWCGTGWTGQPTVFRSPNDTGWWVGIGGYNRRVNFFDPSSGREVLPAFATGDIIKGTITVDPDGFPLVYTGSRDNFFRVIAIDGDEPRELWRLSANDDAPTLWNNDWDSSALVIEDHLLVGGENSRFYVVKLNRRYRGDGSVAVNPEVVFSTAGWDAELLRALGDRQVSIENSVAVGGDTVYFTNSGGLVQGWDLSGLSLGRTPTRVFRYWTGDDTDASIAIDDEGMLYVASEFERRTARSRELGQVFKLDPSRPADPLVWSQFAEAGRNTGVWATPAIHQDLVIVPTADGRVLGLDRADGGIRWTIDLPGPLWSSPVVVDDMLIQGDCEGVLHAFDLSRTDRRPPKQWALDLGGCIESTPAVWEGQIFLGTRSGSFYAIGDRR